MIVALAGLSLLACNKKEEIVPDEKPAGKYTYTIAVAGDTKSHLAGDHMAWDETDMIGWFINNNAFDCSEIDIEATPRTFEVSSSTALPANSMVYAFAPCYPLVYETTPTKTAAPLSIPVSQSGTISDAMPMVSVPIEIADPVAASTDKPIAEAKFINLGAVIEYNIYTTNASYNAEKVQSVKFTSNSNIAGDFSVNLTTVAENAIPVPSGLTEDTVTSTLASATTVGGSKATGIKVYQVIAPGTWSGTVTVTTDAAVYEYPVTSKEFNRATIKTLNVDLASANATRISLVEYMLTAHQWELKEVQEVGVICTSATGNKLTLNSNHTMAFDCSANSNQTYDHTWSGGLIAPNKYGEVANMRWSTTSSGDMDYLTVTDGFLLVFAQASMTGEYEIEELTDSKLRVKITTYDEAWTLKFDAVNDSPTPGVETTWDHTIASGDFGLTETVENAESITATISGKTWTVSTDSHYYCIKEQWPWAGLALWCANGWNNNALLLTLESSDFDGVISSVGIDLSLAGNEHQLVSCSVGGTSYGSQEINNDDEKHPQQTVTFTGSSSGTIVITVDNSLTCGIPMMFRGLHVTYTPD